MSKIVDATEREKAFYNAYVDAKGGDTAPLIKLLGQHSFEDGLISIGLWMREHPSSFEEFFKKRHPYVYYKLVQYVKQAEWLQAFRKRNE